MGADGLIGSTYNLMPAAFVRLYAAFQAGDVAEARRLQHAVNRVIAVLLKGDVGARTKAAMHLTGIDAGALRRPGRPLSPDEHIALRRDVLDAGLEELVPVREVALAGG